MRNSVDINNILFNIVTKININAYLLMINYSVA